jgi:3-oxoacyl-[acyl-carrier-protein] synthase-1
MVTPLGTNADRSCAAIRARINNAMALDYEIENDDFEIVPVNGCQVRGITDGHLGLGRWTKLTTTAIKDLMSSVNFSGVNIDKTQLHIALPENTREGLDDRLTEMLGLRVAQNCPMPGIEERSHYYEEGRAGVFLALGNAMTALENQEAQWIIIGGVDSLVEPDTLKFLHEKNRLKTDDNSDGLVPGEGAAFLLLETLDMAIARQAQPMALIEAPSIAQEENLVWSDSPSIGEGLSQAISATFERLHDKGTQTAIVLGDINGESYYGKEFGTIVPRVFKDVQFEWVLWTPASFVGDTGAAASAIATAVGARALEKGYARTKNIALWGASDDGLRGAAYLRGIQ